jgi:hypothetical protein
MSYKDEIERKARLYDQQNIHNATPQPVSNNNKGIIYFFIIVGVIAFVFWIDSTDDLDRSSKAYVPDSHEAFYMAKELMKKSLKAPSTADFAAYHESTINNLGADEWRVSSYVDSQNSFGAMIRTTFTIKMKVDRSTKYWKATDLITEP